MNTKNELNYWAAVANVTPFSGNNTLGDADGAYVGIVGLAKYESDFIEMVRVAFSEMNFNLIDVDDIELIDSIELWEGVIDMKEKILKLGSGNAIDFGSFHCYSE